MRDDGKASFDMLQVWLCECEGGWPLFVHLAGLKRARKHDDDGDYMVAVLRWIRGFPIHPSHFGAL